MRDDPRRDPEPSEAPDASFRAIALALANAEQQRLQWQGAMASHVEALGNAARLWIAHHDAGRREGGPVSQHDLDVALQHERDKESLRAKERFVRQVGRLVVGAMKQSWKVAVATIAVAALSLTGAFVMRDCLPNAARAPIVPTLHEP